MQVWTDAALARLTIDDGFRLRGSEMTRLEALTDAAFALALTYLVIAQQQVPRTFAELIDAFRQAPAFAGSFLILALFWMSHVRWSRRYGMADGRAVLLTSVLIFVVLVFVFPLKIILSAFLSQVTGGALPALARLETMEQLREIFIAYGIGFTLLSLSLFGLYRLAAGRADDLKLDAIERFDTHADLGSHRISVVIGVMATALALLLPADMAPLSGYSYFLIAIERPLYWRRVRAKRREIAGMTPVSV